MKRRGHRKKNTSSTSTRAAWTIHLYHCIDFKVSIWSSGLAMHSCCTATWCAHKRTVQLMHRRQCRHVPATSDMLCTDRSAVQGIRSTLLPFPDMYTSGTLPSQRQGWGMQTSLIPSSRCYRVESFLHYYVPIGLTKVHGTVWVGRDL